jgi:hypothetical protein
MLAALAFLAVGCRNVIAEPLPSALRAEALCVEQHAQDKRNLATLVSASLRDAGVEARAAGIGGCAGETPYVVTYVDNWSWDLRLYLQRMTIEVSDGATGEILAYGESYQDSLGAIGTSHRDVIDRAVAALLGAD